MEKQAEEWTLQVLKDGNYNWFVTSIQSVINKNIKRSGTTKNNDNQSFVRIFVHVDTLSQDSVFIVSVISWFLFFFCNTHLFCSLDKLLSHLSHVTYIIMIKCPVNVFLCDFTSSTSFWSIFCPFFLTTLLHFIEVCRHLFMASHLTLE